MTLKLSKGVEGCSELGLTEELQKVLSETKGLYEFIELLSLFNQKNDNKKIKESEITKLISIVKDNLNNKFFIDKLKKEIGILKIGDCLYGIKIDSILFNFIKVFQKTIDCNSKSYIKIELLERYLKIKSDNIETFKYKEKIVA